MTLAYETQLAPGSPEIETGFGHGVCIAREREFHDCMYASAACLDA